MTLYRYEDGKFDNLFLVMADSTEEALQKLHEHEVKTYRKNWESKIHLSDIDEIDFDKNGIAELSSSCAHCAAEW